MENAFLPPSYDIPSSGSRYMKFQKGDNRFRILAPPILGNEFWIEKDGKRSPVRRRIGEPISIDELPNEDPSDIRHFWAMPVLDYAEKSVKVLEITQKGVQKTIRELSRDADWGSPLDYDLSVTKSGDGMETEYSVVPKPKKAIGPETKKLWEEALAGGFNLEALFESGDPFTWGVEKDSKDLSPAPAVPENIEEVNIDDIPF